MKRLILGLTAGLSAIGPVSAAVDFSKDVRPLIEQHCLACHGAQGGAGGLNLTSRAGLTAGGANGPVVVGGDAAASALFMSLEKAPGEKGAMPPGMQLPAEARQAIRQWIEEGANWPESLTLGGPVEKPADDQALTAGIRDKILAGENPTDESGMKAYSREIPGRGVFFDMAPIRGGEFTMGSPESEVGRKEDEGPQHRVKVDPFWMGVREVTWNEYRLFMFEQGQVKDELVDAVSRPTKPYVEMSFGMGIDGYPAISMTQHAARKYTQWLSAQTGEFYRLPTEAEWEYACRAGTTTAYSFGDDPAPLGEYDWFWDNADVKYQQVGKKKPNPWGLFDMHGNVAEWTLDQYVENAYSQAGELSVNPLIIPETEYPRVARGGSWNDDPDMLRCAARRASDESWKMQDPQLPKSIWYLTDAQWLGLRVVRPLKVPSVEDMHRYWNNGRPTKK